MNCIAGIPYSSILQKEEMPGEAQSALLHDSEKSCLRWACIDCRPLEINFYCHLKESKIELAALKKDFDKVFLSFKISNRSLLNFIS